MKTGHPQGVLIEAQVVRRISRVEDTGEITLVFADGGEPVSLGRSRSVEVLRVWS